MRQSVLLALRHIEMHDVLAKQLSVEPHRRQRVLDLMRKTTGHRTELGESLGVPRLTFRFTRPVHHATQQHHHHGQHDRDGGADADTQPEQFHMDLLVCQVAVANDLQKIRLRRLPQLELQAAPCGTA